MLYNKILSNYRKRDKNTLFFSDGKNKYSWSESSNFVSYLISNYLLNLIGKNTSIYITSFKSFETYSLMLACYLTGISYIPIDYKDINKINKLNKKDIIFSSIEIKDNISISYIKYDRKQINEKDFMNDIEKIYEFNGNDIVYKMTSSGTTGKPKIIPINSNNLENYITNINKIANFNSGDSFAQIPNLTFDISVHDLFLAFYHNGTLVPVATELAPFLGRILNKMSINHLMAVPSYIDIALKNIKENVFSVQNIFLCGEALRTDVANKIKKRFKQANCFNLYGPTECTIAILFYKFSDRDNNTKLDQIPIGTPFTSNEAILSENQELCISGKQVFNGYLSDNPSPFLFFNNKKFYKTGDICRTIGSNYYFQGRIGFQIKYRGYRVEIEGIEAQLSNYLNEEIIAIPHDEISKCNYNQITLFHTNKDLDMKKSYDILPPHLYNINYKYIEEIPRSPSFKINRKEIAIKYL